MSSESFVVDASAIVELLLATATGGRITERIRSCAGLFAPSHVDAEVFSALARLARAGTLPADVVGDALDDLALMPITRVSLPALLTEAWTMTNNVSARDALYVVVAKRASAPLVTVDRRLERAVIDHGLASVWVP